MKRNLIGILSLLLLNATGADAQSAVQGNVPFALQSRTDATAGRHLQNQDRIHEYHHDPKLRDRKDRDVARTAGISSHHRVQTGVSPSRQPVPTDPDIWSRGQHGDVPSRFQTGAGASGRQWPVERQPGGHNCSQLANRRRSQTKSRNPRSGFSLSASSVRSL